MTTMKNKKMKFIGLSIVLGTPVLAWAAPDAGQVLQNNQPTLQAPKSNKPIKLDQTPAPVKADGTVTIQTIEISGNTLYPTDTLLALLDDVKEKKYSTKELEGVAARISRHYRGNGYPLVRAVISVSALKKNTLSITVVEGKYGKVTAAGEAAADENGPSQYLSNLKTGEFITSDSLERATLILDDMPGMQAHPIIRPGQNVGEGDLTMQIERQNYYDGRIGVDNAGSRPTGQNRISANVNFNSPFMFGDRLALRSSYTNENLFNGGIDYELPLNSDGLRALVGVAHTNYSLAGQWSSLNGKGTAEVQTLRLSYPIVRSQASNLYASLGFVNKQLKDEQDGTGGREYRNKTSQAVPVALQFDVRDAVAGGGITYGGLTSTTGKLNLKDLARTEDAGATGANTQGHIQKWNFDLARIQRLPDDFSFYARYSLQYSKKNLDNSEGFATGGPNGVRAYPTIDALGSKGYLVQTELRYQVVGNWTSFAFYDAATAKSADMLNDGSFYKRHISGYGIGLRQDSRDWDLETTLAWRGQGGAVQSEEKDHNPRFWLRAGYKF